MNGGLTQWPRDTRSRAALDGAACLKSSFWVLLVSGRFAVSQTIIPEAQEHFLTPSAPRDNHLFGGLGFRSLSSARGSLVSRRSLWSGMFKDTVTPNRRFLCGCSGRPCGAMLPAALVRSHGWARGPGLYGGFGPSRTGGGDAARSASNLARSAACSVCIHTATAPMGRHGAARYRTTLRGRA